MGSIRQRKDGRWEGRYTAPDGKQKSVYASTPEECGKQLRAKQHEIDTGAWREPSSMTVSEWLDIWLADYQTHNADRTVMKYKSITDKHFKPVLGNIKIMKLLPLHIRRLITSMKGLKPITIKNYVRILGASMNCAIEAGLIKSNPVDHAKLPRIQPTKFTVVDRADIPAFITAANNTDYANELLLMLYTGLRVGELRGLQWVDVDLDNGTIHVQRQLHPVNHDMQRFSAPKYGEDRIIHIPEDAITILKNQRKKQAEQRLAAGGWEDDAVTRNLVFRIPSGHAHNDRTIYKAVKAVGKAIGKPELHPHDLRHSYAVAALRSGIDVKTVQHNLGHKTAQMTLDVYAAYTEDAGKAAAATFSNYLRNANSSN
jgi:integrase